MKQRMRRDRPTSPADQPACGAPYGPGGVQVWPVQPKQEWWHPFLGTVVILPTWDHLAVLDMPAYIEVDLTDRSRRPRRSSR